MKFSVALVAALALTGGANAQFCSDCKWGVNKVVSYVEQNGNADVCSAVLSEVQSYTMDLCNSLDGCSSYVTNMCNQVLQQIESDAGAALAADNIDATSICTAVGACESSSASSGSDDETSADDDRRVRRSGASSWATSFCSNECQQYPNPSECMGACVNDVSHSARQLKQAINVKMLEDERKSPTITLSTGEVGHCVRDMETNHFLCSVNHHQASLAAQPSSSSPNTKSSSTISTGAIVGIAVGAVAAVLIIALVGFKARSENKRNAAPTGSSVLLVQDDAEYATA